VVELLYAMRSIHWRKGFASEAAEACLAFGFGELALEEIAAFTLPTNLGSRAVMTGRGFVYVRPIVHAGLPHLLYRLRRDVWSGGRAAPHGLGRGLLIEEDR